MSQSGQAGNSNCPFHGMAGRSQSQGWDLFVFKICTYVNMRTRLLYQLTAISRCVLLTNLYYVI